MNKEEINKTLERAAIIAFCMIWVAIFLMFLSELRWE